MLYKLISNALYSKKIKNMIKRIHVRLVNKKRNFFTKGCMSDIIFENDLATIRKSKVTLKINKPAYIGKCVLELNKALMHEFLYEHGTSSILLFTDNDS